FRPDAACGGLGSPPARRARRAYLHHWHSTLCGLSTFYVETTSLSGHTAHERDLLLTSPGAKSASLLGGSSAHLATHNSERKDKQPQVRGHARRNQGHRNRDYEDAHHGGQEQIALMRGVSRKR